MNGMNPIIVTLLCLFSLPMFAGLPLRSLYTDEEARKSSGAFIEKRRITEDVDVFIHEQESYLLWTQGPQMGRVFSVVKKKEGAKFDPPSIEGLEKLMDNAIEQYAKANDKPFATELKYGLKRQVHATSRQQYEVMSSFAKDAFNYLERKYGDYYLREAQYFTFTPNQNETLRLFAHINKVGLPNFVHARAIKRLLNPEIARKLDADKTNAVYLAFEKCINNFGEERPKHSYSIDICEPDQSTLNEAVRANFKHFLNEVKSKWYLDPPYGVGSIGEENFKDVKDFRPEKLYLSHGSSSQKLPNILQLGGLASIKYAKGKGVVKSTGGEMGGEGGLDPSKVSFYEISEKSPLRLGYGKKVGFEYPIALVVGARSRGKLQCYNAASERFGKMDTEQLERLWRNGQGGINIGPNSGSGVIPQEKTVPSFFPIECIDYIFAPPFAVDEITMLLKEQKLEIIEVLPFPASSIKSGSD